MLGNFQNMGLLVYRLGTLLSFGNMPKRKIAPTLGPNKRKNVAISIAVKNEIREMIKAGLNKSQVESQLQKEKKDNVS